MNGAGNDFILVFEEYKQLNINQEFIKKICHRQYGIGGDGIIFIKKSKEANIDIKWDFFNCDGSRAEMCGNGLRCAAKFANKYIDKKKINIKTDVGVLKTEILNNNNVKIEIPIIEVPISMNYKDDSILYSCNTGVPHITKIMDDISDFDIIKEGCELRNSHLFKTKGTNVNFISITNNSEYIPIRTYERGVEGETLACGTGIAASALILNKFFQYNFPINFMTKANDIISIDIKKDNLSYVFLTGPVEEVFNGYIEHPVIIPK